MEQTGNKELRMSRTFNAPIQLIWKAWTDPAHIIKWWGPDGFTTTIHIMDLSEGGEWKLTLHGPDGKNYPNRSIFRKIVLHKEIVLEHYNPHFMTTVLFESTGEHTYLDWKLEFDTPEMRETIVRVHKADEGHKQNFERLQLYLHKLRAESHP